MRGRRRFAACGSPAFFFVETVQKTVDVSQLTHVDLVLDKVVRCEAVQLQCVDKVVGPCSAVFSSGWSGSWTTSMTCPLCACRGAPVPQSWVLDSAVREVEQIVWCQCH